MRLPYFKWYPADAETDENFLLMSDEEIGHYVRWLNHAWINDGIPADPGERARVFKKTRAKSEKLWRRVGKCFVPHPDDDSRLVNPRQHKERIEALESAEVFRQAGMRSGEVRRKKAEQKSEPPYEPPSKDVRTRTSDSVSECAFEVLKENQEAPKTEIAVVNSAPLEELLRMFVALGRGMTVSDRMRCENQWNALAPPDQTRALHHARASLSEWQTRPTEKIAQPWNYLRERHWERAAPRLLTYVPARPYNPEDDYREAEEDERRRAAKRGAISA